MFFPSARCHRCLSPQPSQSHTGKILTQCQRTQRSARLQAFFHLDFFISVEIVCVRIWEVGRFYDPILWEFFSDQFTHCFFHNFFKVQLPDGTTSSLILPSTSTCLNTRRPMLLADKMSASKLSQKIDPSVLWRMLAFAIGPSLLENVFL